MTTDIEIKDEETAAQEVISVIGAAPKAIKSDDEYETGMQWLAGVVSKRKRIEAFFESIKKPIRLSLKTVGDKEKAILEPLEKEQSALKRLTGDYFMKKKVEQEEKQRKENEKHQQRVEKAVEAGKPAESVAPPKVIETLPTTVKGENGAPTATMRLVKNWRVTKVPTICQQGISKTYRSDHPALTEIPDSCWMLDTARANAEAKSGMTPALELYDVPSQAVSG